MHIRGLRRAKERLSRIDIGESGANALGLAAQTLKSQVVENLSRSPGDDHSMPWLQTGTLRGSIDCDVQDNIAVVGSTSDVAVDQELGTMTIEPRSFLGSTAAEAVEDIVSLVAMALIDRLAET